MDHSGPSAFKELVAKVVNKRLVNDVQEKELVISHPEAHIAHRFYLLWWQQQSAIKRITAFFF